MTIDLSGQTIKGYRLHQQIGQGRFATVYQASQPQMHRDVTVKVIHRELANHPEFVRKFETEAQLIARLEHIHIVPLYDYWREPDRAFLVMRWLRGGSLRDALMTYGPMPVDVVAKLLEQIASALMLAHRKQVVHRDIKPENILLDEEGNAYLTDFGISMMLDSDSERTRETLLFGTPAYMAPELFGDSAPTPQVDIYALGVMLYELLTGSRPFPNVSTEELMRLHVSAPIPSLQAVGLPLPQDLNFVIWRATAKAPEARYANAQELAAAFRTAVFSGTDLRAETPLPPVPATVLNAGGKGPTTLIIEQPVELENPYKGLRPFEQADAADFYGREALVARLLDRLGTGMPRFLALVGPSGSGKSSVIKAGLLPALRARKVTATQSWFTVEMVPGAEPFRALESALQSVALHPMGDMFAQLTADPDGLIRVVEQILPPDRSTRLLLLIDQFEEVFTHVAEEEKRQRFLQSIHAAVHAKRGLLHVVITLRADYYDRPLLYEGFGALMRQCSEVILPLTAQELKQAVEKPASRLGVIVEPELVTAIVADVNQQPGALPLLQYALTEIFEHRKQHLLTLDIYRGVGGISTALAHRAEEIYGGLDEAAQDLTRQLFLRLVRLEEEAEATRRRVGWSSLLTLSEDEFLIERIRDAFVEARLLTMDHDPKTREPTIEVAHEALLREWDRLVKWLEASREDIHMQRRLNIVAAEWHAAEKDRGYLLTSTRLDQFEEWAVRANLQLTREEREFLQASLAEREARLIAEQARLKRERMLERRLRNRLVGLVMVLGMATLIGFLIARFALDQQQMAEDRLRDLRTLTVADWAAMALADDDPELALALLFAIRGPLDELPVQVQQVLYRAAYTPGARMVYEAHDDTILSVAISPDGTLVASSSGRINPLSAKVDNALSIWDVTTGEELFHLDADSGGHTDTVMGLAFSPDGQMLASGSADHTIILWDVETGAVVRRLEGHEDLVARVAFSPDGQTLVSVSGNFLLTALPLPPIGTPDATVRVWEVATGEQLRIFGGPDGGHQAPVMSLALSPDGRTVVTGDADGIIIVWDFETGRELRRMESLGDWVSSIAFVPNSTQIVSALGKPSIAGSGATSTVMALWDVETGARIRDFSGHTNIVIGVAVSADGRTALSGSADMSVRLWDIETGAELHRFTGHDGWVFCVAVSPDGRWAVSGAIDTTVRVWDLEAGNLQQRFTTADTTLVHAIDLSPDGSLALSGHEDGQIVLWDTGTGQQIRHFDHDRVTKVLSIAFSPDAQYAVSGDDHGRVTLWDVRTGAAVRHFEGHASAVLDVRFSPDGTRIGTASGSRDGVGDDGDNTARVWDVTTGVELQRQEHPDSVWSVAFSPDGRLVVSSSGPLFGGGTQAIYVWDVDSGNIIAEINGHADLAGSVVFAPDGRTLLSGSDDSTIRLWNVDNGREIRRFEGHTGFINTVVIDPSGRVMLSGSDDDTIRLWSVATGEELYRIEGYHGTIQGLALSADGRLLLAVSTDNVMLLWRVDRDLGELAAWVKVNRVIRDLTCAERDTYRMEPLCDGVSSP